LGPSGCGKTTVLRIIAGFEHCDGGDILIAGQRVNQVPANQRNTNTVFQSYALFPHMTIFENVAFGLKVKGHSKTEVQSRVNEVLKMVQLEEFASRKPHELSGGQQQRVALARAAVNKPLVLLLDESLSALDYKLRKKMQIELKNLQRQLGITFVFVTHDQEEALSMSDRIVVINEGKIEQIGTPREIYERPNNLFVAQFVGEINVFDGVVLQQLATDQLKVNLEGVECTLKSTARLNPGQQIQVTLRPEDLRVVERSRAKPGQNYLFGEVTERTYKGSTLDSIIRLENGKVVQASEFFDEEDPDFDYTLGEKVAISWVSSWETILEKAD
ncbi:MAG TPA: spermidine/putrescine ABC transporter ATP-binding protein PotA, partial [Pseudomonadales bacterium]|nr:spermidine/putrescine ABC transporter ATP-binding protein PotA [Pseudomonadales bacterium]